MRGGGGGVEIAVTSYRFIIVRHFFNVVLDVFGGEVLRVANIIIELSVKLTSDNFSRSRDSMSKKH